MRHLFISLKATEPSMWNDGKMDCLSKRFCAILVSPSSQEKPLSEFGRRWNNHNGGANSTTDMDSDYRREMAGLASGTTGVHHEARGRDGGGASTLQRRHRVRGARPGDSSADASPVAGAR